MNAVWFVILAGIGAFYFNSWQEARKNGLRSVRSVYYYMVIQTRMATKVLAAVGVIILVLWALVVLQNLLMDYVLAHAPRIDIVNIDQD